MEGPARLKEWRGKRSLLELGRVLDCDPSYVSYLERGQRTPPLALAIKLHNLAGIAVDQWPNVEALTEPDAADADDSSPATEPREPNGTAPTSAPAEPHA